MTTIEQLEQQLEHAKTLVDVRNMSQRLAQNPDFKKLILNGFCLTDAARFAQESGDPCLTAEQRADALAMAQASGHLKRFLMNSFQMGAVAERDIPQLEEAIAELRTEGAE